MISIAARVAARKMPPAVAFKVRSSGSRLMPPPGNSDPPPFPKRSLRSRHQLASCILRLLSQRIKTVIAVGCRGRAHHWRRVDRQGAQQDAAVPGPRAPAALSTGCVRIVCEHFRITRPKRVESVHLPSQDCERIHTIQAIHQNSGRLYRGWMRPASSLGLGAAKCSASAPAGAKLWFARLGIYRTASDVSHGPRRPKGRNRQNSGRSARFPFYTMRAYSPVP
jgi:hypothetical protein